jgi:hypothetical protein
MGLYFRLFDLHRRASVRDRCGLYRGLCLRSHCRCRVVSQRSTAATIEMYGGVASPLNVARAQLLLSPALLRSVTCTTVPNGASRSRSFASPSAGSIASALGMPPIHTIARPPSSTVPSLMLGPGV